MGTSIGTSMGGGSVTGGSVTGGSVTGGSVTGGSVTGGSVTGGSVTGGSVTGGSVTGGSVVGGDVVGGSVVGGDVVGGSVTGGFVVLGGFVLGGFVLGGFVVLGGFGAGSGRARMAAIVGEADAVPPAAPRFPSLIVEVTARAWSLVTAAAPTCVGTTVVGGTLGVELGAGADVVVARSAELRSPGSPMMSR